MTPPTWASMFSGIGGLDRGLELAGFGPPVWQCEIDPHARKVLARHWPGVTCYPNVEELNGADIAAVDLLCGGFPCQDLSVAGRRAGLAGERSGLFYSFMRIVAALSPTWLLIENVPGLLTSYGGRDMGIVLGTLADLGYGWAYRVLDAQYFGVAQRRRRVFIVGHLGGAARAAEVLFESDCGEGDSASCGEAPAHTPAGVDGSAGGHSVRREVGRTLSAHAGRIDADTETFIAFSHTQGLDAQASESLWPTLRAEGGGQAVVSFAENMRGTVREMPSIGTLAGPGGKPGQGYPAIRQGMAVRRLTPTECERLQGFPDGWTDNLADSARYCVLGNAVCVPVAKWIGERILRSP